MRSELLSSIIPAFVQLAVGAGQPLPPYVAALKDASRAKTIAALIAFENFLKATGTTFSAGNAATIADFQLYAEFVDVFYLGITFAEYPTINAWYKAVSVLPGIKEVHDEWHNMVPGARAALGLKKKTTLEYFPVHGRALPLRMAFWRTDADFVDERVGFGEFGANKAAGVYR